MVNFLYLKKCSVSPACTSGCTIDRLTTLYFSFSTSTPEFDHAQLGYRLNFLSHILARII
ncbi:hypothetical protein SCLCIDRAFT_1224323 [Scleroderma citrinum Foug A]|uniref:Uncharacterized protein n=1 Tax=Scleroderma citrinum Foug A TaxID=1036808 RepID=A0A0C2YPJ6_9AGAM|nr:hypothetical protein SCLCIDRAFT_1224323 [Scleroderma citrinum Foug A]